MMDITGIEKHGHPRMLPIGCDPLRQVAYVNFLLRLHR